MVLSKIAEDINYTETSKLRLSDKDHSSCLYIIPLYENDYLVALGKQNSEYANKEIVYYNIYLLNQKHKIKKKSVLHYKRLGGSRWVQNTPRGDGNNLPARETPFHERNK